MEKGGGAAVREASRFLNGTGAVHLTLKKVTATLQELGVPYAVCGAMALNAHGYRRCTVDVDVAESDLSHVKTALLPFGYQLTGKRSVRDLETAVTLDLYAGQPEVSQWIDGICYVTLASLIEVKIKLGAHPAWIKHLADVQELIKHVQPPRELSLELSDEAREVFERQWDLVMSSPRELW